MTFLQQIKLFSSYLDLVNNHDYQFDQNFRPQKNFQTPPRKLDVLNHIFDNLKKAPVLCVETAPLKKFITVFDKYTSDLKEIDNPKEKRDVNNLASKIQSIAKGEMNKVQYFQSEEAKQINIILDKVDFGSSDYALLYDLATFLAFKRLKAHVFYRTVAIMLRIEKLLNENPTLMITQDHKGYKSSILARIPSHIQDLSFFLLIEFFKNQKEDFSLFDLEFLKMVVLKKTETNDVFFGEYLQAFLSLNLINQLADQYRNHNDIKTLHKLLQAYTSPKTSVNFYKKEFDFSTPSYNELHKYSGEDTGIFDGKGKEFRVIAKELFISLNCVNDDLDRWYKAIYSKIVNYKNSHPESELPFMDPEEFVNKKDFVSFIDLPLEKQFQDWEQEALKTSKKRSKSSAKENGHQDTLLISNSERPSEPEEQQALSETKIPIKNKEPKPPFQTFVEQAKTEIPLFNDNVQTSKKLDQLLVESSPFEIKKRILKWFCNPPETLPIKNAESLFIHNFAWAVNDILWHFGLRYPHQNETAFQPAIAMLCQVEHNLYSDKEVMQVTATFNSILQSNDIPFTIEKSWKCYHRTLTRRPQNNQVVDNYIGLGKYQFIDFPALPSQRILLEVPESMFKKYPDGSYIERVEGSTITIRDPKNDLGKTACRLHLFVVR